ncbi:MAG TPA: NADH:ubiquinone reductase (Na(+)-transporting) subunit C [Fermentimonas caenicola]|jgi:Na+-transporting NADH:ubiquinone oxidoreductase subunit C|uniref:Na(+)-translocating NADH-quinone reductase subunit C n=1 Tax=Fermentimonas caenicola TaxID=1562970 RepID=A0A098BXU3_9BACT|nr:MULTISPECIES: NADH:ubiquinone reductase (Na(+)-transporting) subunit C [Lascolabacillus]MBP6176185.1 NADH:ubiquinone reductase (Na(+)-transporting) subunit C [Fermentimonas sp.]MDI9626123.1 NADH:ubiquinone reductase (Na(+)-transporting) subunit C [Bacteroidota bacterium]CEA15484.1 Na(+)-translocating NADH-quinone reductase subunit C [Fermentimonas caenicola]MBP6197525.1 NADH:ubiquinone reductase (Na(+)-transporting) subunit C [Fermentimonas sp.]MBP7103850.1 NADH:ubiquinone reductase (Na(+)-
MNRENNGYTIIYAAVMVIIVALGLSLTHQSLLDKQIANENIDKMQQLLRSLNITADASEAEDRYAELITNAYLITDEGDKIEGTEGTTPADPAFSTELGDPAAQGLPVYEVSIDGKNVYIIPMSGAGLWGAIWGYLAVEDDGSTIYGADFGHAGETPGLGAEIAQSAFGNQFVGKEIIKNGNFLSVAVVKPGQTDSRRDYVDGISGGTITSQGVDKMLLNSVGEYENFLMKLNRN